MWDEDTEILIKCVVAKIMQRGKKLSLADFQNKCKEREGEDW